MKGGDKKIIIHISGPSGSGKTFLGNKLKDKFGNKIIVKDIDDLRDDFINKHYGQKKWSVIDKDAYQKHIDKYVKKQTKPIVFVGLNNMPWWHKNHYYNMHSNNNFYIKLNDKTIMKQKCLRLFNDIPNQKDAINDMLNNNKRFIKIMKENIDVECNLQKIEAMNKKWNKDYENQGYKFMSQENIFEKIVNIINQ
jgi:uridine kinase